MTRSNLAAAAVCLAGVLVQAAGADVRFFTDRPLTNSSDFRDRCSFLGLTARRAVDFSLPPEGPLAPGFFEAAEGVRVATVAGSSNIETGSGSLPGNTAWDGRGEGRLPEPARYLHTGYGAVTTVDVTFDPPVRAFGLMTADLFYWWQGVPTATLEAFTASGQSLGRADAFNQNFEFDDLYFMGVVDTAGRIARVRFVNTAQAGDSVYLTEAWTARGDLRCRADFNADGFVDFFDYDTFVTCFESGSCPPGGDADFNDDGFSDFFDYDAFVALFETGC